MSAGPVPGAEDTRTPTQSVRAACPFRTQQHAKLIRPPGEECQGTFTMFPPMSIIQPGIRRHEDVCHPTIPTRGDERGRSSLERR